MIRHSKHVLFMGIHGFDASVLDERPLFPPFLSKIKDHPWNGTNLVSYDNLSSFSDSTVKYVLFFGIHGFGALILQEKLFFPPFSLESKFAHQIRHTWILMIISILMVIEHNKHIFVIRMLGFDALDFLEKLKFP